MELSKDHAHDLVSQGDPGQVGETFRRYAAEHGITFLQGHLPVIWYHDGDRRQGMERWFDFSPASDTELEHAFDLTKRWIDLFAAIGIHSGVLHMGGSELKQAGWADDAVFERRVAALSRIAAYAASVGIAICLENMTFPNCGVVTFEEISAFIAGTRAGNVAVCLDTGHALQAGVGCAEFILKAQGLLRALHIAENDGTNDEHLLPYERGTIDWPRVVRALRQIGYAGPFNLEVLSERGASLPDREAGLDRARELVRGMLEGD
jgi:sugar phosphate isomerase/epimerase